MSQPDDLWTNLQPGSFDGIIIPVVEIEMHTANARARHQYPHRPGQRIEYTGREPLRGSITAAYFPGVEEGGKDVLWPDALQTLRKRIQEQRSGKLVIPVIGEIPKASLTLHERYSPTAREGTFVTIDFEEDNAEDVVAGVGVSSAIGKLSSSAEDAENAVAALRLRLADLGTDEDGNAITSLTQYVANLQGNLERINDDIARPISQAAGLVRRIDELLETASVLIDPRNWAARDALLELRDATSRCVVEAINASRPIRTFLVATRTTAAAVAAATGNEVADILALNALEDGNSIEEGEEILVYDVLS